MLKSVLKSWQNIKLTSWQVNELTSVLVCECMGLQVGEWGSLRVCELTRIVVHSVQVIWLNALTPSSLFDKLMSSFSFQGIAQFATGGWGRISALIVS